MGWVLVFALLALVLGVVAAITTVQIKRRAEGDPWLRITVIWPSGPVEYRWPKR